MKTPAFHIPAAFASIRVEEPYRYLLVEELAKPPTPLEFYCPDHKEFHPILSIMILIAGLPLPSKAFYRTTAPLPDEYTIEPILRDTAEASAPANSLSEAAQAIAEIINTAATEQISLVDYKVGEVIHSHNELWIIEEVKDSRVHCGSRKGTMRGVMSRTFEELATGDYEIWRDGKWIPCRVAPKPPGLPAWQCHKKVNAFQIGMVEARPSGNFTLHGVDRNHSAVVSKKWMMQHKTVREGGYYVKYEDGYESYSPRSAFEAGYTRL